MGMIIPGMTAGTAASASSPNGKAMTAGTTTGATAVFGQSLQQIMGQAATVSNSGTAETPSNPLLAALQQLITAAGQVSEDGEHVGSQSTEELDAQVEKLMKQLDGLDEQLTQNPELMTMLQNWIQQAQVVLQSQSTKEDSQGDIATATAESLQPLASNPATLKFALQDTVAQLIDMQKSNQTAPEVKVQAQQVLASLEQTMKQVANQAKSVDPKQTLASNPEVVSQQNEMQQGVKVDQTVKTTSEAQAKSTDAAIVSSKTQAQQQEGHSQPGDSQNEEPAQEFKLPGTITAGELALRTNGTAPAKPVEAVPVHRMAQEVEKLVVDRLEILQKQGFTEAKISLTPDHLGKVDIRITMHAGQLMAHFVTEHAAAKDLLEQQMVQLRGSLQGQGLTVERLEVTQSSSLQSQMDQNGGQQSNGQQQGRRSRSREEGTDDARLTAELSEELGEWLREKSAAQSGSSFIAEA
ncbi:flagellar hook-length control protein FliK [Saccharibacillus sp. JS10]|uniref:flagellar hook-length control protein FliK n=1 Tax=Saccharibacillus sp. JS10 TaxID=2950552 RepID=UPI00210D67E3|nr:flagellar hook-length control protein FliK [Saccharibacillus sp. JS10]MCQ4087191.1 flagellar hook-length control protein FliK [Saccharibacillus sp. JS10]